LVVLSACQSALGKILDGDEVVGFPRAFMYAGTPLVVASLWNINDEAGFLLMCSFYRYLSYHYSYSESLRTAQLDIMKGKFKCLALPSNSQDRAISFQHPYYWAPFVIYGYDRSLLDDRTQDVRE
ncbi:MAG TPA: CHAT domain-containing protein, partial [candidate division Zixibacteria bacterium]|nr:CHAT domain-containing protein [candidate division Zixibacteria bacterium]